MDEYDRKMLKWQFENTDRRIRQLEAQQKEQKENKASAGGRCDFGREFGEHEAERVEGKTGYMPPDKGHRSRRPNDQTLRRRARQGLEIVKRQEHAANPHE